METTYALQQIQSSYIREILEAATNPNVISLAGGLPDQTTFPIELMKPTLEGLSAMPEVFQYGETAGYGPLIKHLTAEYELPDHHKAMVTTGSQQGLDLIARAYVNPNDTVAMEAPCYLGAMQVFGLCQANIVTVEQNTQGPDLEQLEHCFKQQKPKMFYAVPDFHNPTGVCWSLATRKRVAQLCEQYNVALIEDSPYREIRFSGEALPLVSSFCPDHAIVLRSFSKIASPGLRIGVVTGKASYIEPMIKVKQGADLHSSVPMQALLLGLLEHLEFEEHIRNIRDLYQARCNKLTDELTNQLPSSCSFSLVEGGMFVWVKVPECDTFELAKTLLESGVAVVPSAVFYPKGAAVQSALRLNFTNSSLDELTLGVTRIKQALVQSVS
ncbi:PLP-dependent aminotransferase family protein [Vibrio tapetis subsp. quintayensis]|uniref:aminotransferase-like domain-containing protein n=1 Tax=Vibrio tapetis TaxID=52443 RepID=UPI0025B57E39|nr:PLP-dependent aminotransferase family protein [Vibrio tapetis]MDN3681883.1 PLP-dependent aminotransferase family protein [Vibrio tapetis subsp. quintayensis]